MRFAFKPAARQSPRKEPHLSRRLAIRFLLVLCILILFPFVKTLLPFGPIASVEELRTSSGFPSLALLTDRDNSAFADGLTQWFDDRVGFRDILIRLKNQIDYTIFRTARKVYIGRDEWLFERNTTDARLDLERISDDAFADVRNSFVKLAAILAERGIQLVVVGYPDKSMVYPEHLPSDVPRFPENSRWSELRRELRGDRSFSFIDAEAILAEHKVEGDLFYKTDIHINFAGQSQVLKTLIHTIAALDGKDVEWREEFDWQRIFYGNGSEARFLSILTRVGETVAFAKNLYQIGVDTAAGH